MKIKHILLAAAVAAPVMLSGTAQAGHKHHNCQHAPYSKSIKIGGVWLPGYGHVSITNYHAPYPAYYPHVIHNPHHKGHGHNHGKGHHKGHGGHHKGKKHHH